MAVPKSKKIAFHYKFTFPTGKVQTFQVELDPQTLQILLPERTDFPDWARLSFHQCTNCPLNESQNPRCPIAANLTDVIDFFKDAVSYETMEVEISTAERTFKKQTALQEGLSSLMGIYMVTSGCPVMDKLRPLVRTHLPFATLEETTYRAIAMYALVQLLRVRHGQKPDWELKYLTKIYEDIQTVNVCFRERLAGIHIEDAGLNALVRLDAYAQFTNMQLLELGLENIEKLFAAYLEEPGAGGAL